MSEKLKNGLIPKYISRMYLDVKSSDVKFMFNSGDQKVLVPAHKAFLASASKVFYTKFFGSLKKGDIIEITDVSADAFKEFLQLFYLPEVAITSLESIGEVIRLADKYDMVDHLNICIAHLKSKLSDDKILWAYQLAIELNNQRLKYFCEEKLTTSMANIFESDAFLRCDRQVLKHILHMDRMSVDEIDVIDACVAWAKSSCRQNGLDENDPCHLKIQLGDCFYLIRFGTLSKTDIDAITSNEQYFGLFVPDVLGGIIRITTDENYKSAIFNTRVSTYLKELTAGNCESMVKQFRNLKIDTEEKLASVVSLIFEKAIDEPNNSSVCAQLCRKLAQLMREHKLCYDKKKITVGDMLKKQLLNKCQLEFIAHVANENAIREKLKPIQQELDKTTDDDRRIELTAQLEAEEQKLRHRHVGTARFIGELYRQNMLLTSIIEWCVVTLLKIGTDEKLEILCQLLMIVGEKMERKTNDEEYDKKYYRDLTSHFQTMQEIVSNENQSNHVSSRVRSMLADVIELRKNKWVPRRADSNPKEMDQIQEGVQDEQYGRNLQSMASNLPSSSGMHNNDMQDAHMQRGGNMSGGGYNNNNNLN